MTQAVVATLSPEERAHAVIRANDDGQAGAFEMLGRRLPPTASGDKRYWLVKTARQVP